MELVQVQMGFFDMAALLLLALARLALGGVYIASLVWYVTLPRENNQPFWPWFAVVALLPVVGFILARRALAKPQLHEPNQGAVSQLPLDAKNRP